MSVTGSGGVGYAFGMEADPIFPISSDPIAMLEARSELRALLPEVDGLVPRKRKMFVLCVEGWTLQEIGEAFGISGTTVFAHVRRCRWILKHSRPASV